MFGGDAYCCLFGCCLFGCCLFGCCLFGCCLFGCCLFGCCAFRRGVFSGRCSLCCGSLRCRLFGCCTFRCGLLGCCTFGCRAFCCGLLGCCTFRSRTFRSRTFRSRMLCCCGLPCNLLILRVRSFRDRGLPRRRAAIARIGLTRGSRHFRISCLGSPCRGLFIVLAATHAQSSEQNDQCRAYGRRDAQIALRDAALIRRRRRHIRVLRRHGHGRRGTCRCRLRSARRRWA